MNETERLRVRVQSRLDQYVADQAAILANISPDLGPLSEFSTDFLAGGKRFRAIFAYWGWHGVTAVSQPEKLDDPAELATIIDIATAVEIFHAAALVHDDIIDNSSTRRGAPSVHRRYAELIGAHTSPDLADRFGISAAILHGDLLLNWSDELLADTVAAIANRSAAQAVRAEYASMRTEVTAGQYLDVLEENAWRGHSDAELVERAIRILTYKSAKYSVAVPLSLGAHAAAGTPEQLAALGRYGIEVGTAFQLRDDVLGVFGDSSITGKPTGDDIREGKRTLLVALTRAQLSGEERDRFDAAVGNPDLSEAEVARVQQQMIDTGALAGVEARIADAIVAGRSAVAHAPLGENAIAALLTLANRVGSRTA